MKELLAIVSLCSDEFERATTKFPGWPTDPQHALAVVTEGLGELAQAMNRITWEGSIDFDGLRTEATQLAVVALRFLGGLDHYLYRQSILFVPKDRGIFPAPAVKLPRPAQVKPGVRRGPGRVHKGDATREKLEEANAWYEANRESGASLAAAAERVGASEMQLRNFRGNGVRRGDVKIDVPSRRFGPRPDPRSEMARLYYVAHKGQPGVTMRSVAERYEIPLDRLMNRIRNSARRDREKGGVET